MEALDGSGSSVAVGTAVLVGDGVQVGTADAIRTTEDAVSLINGVTEGISVVVGLGITGVFSTRGSAFSSIEITASGDDSRGIKST